MEREKWKEAVEINAKYDNSAAMQAFYDEIVGLRGDRSKIKTRRHILLKFFRDIDMDPDVWLDEVKDGKRDHERDFNDYLKRMASNPDIADNSLKTTRKSFLKFASCMNLPRPKLLGVKSSMKKVDAEPFTKEELIQLLNCCRNPRDRSFIMLAFCSGLRISELCGLEVRDIREIDERKEEPYLIEVRDKIAKGNHGYTSFFSEECADALRALIKAEDKGPNDRLFYSYRTHGAEKEILSERGAEQIFFNLIKRANLPGRRVFHSLRKYTRTALASGHGINESFIEAIIGHNSASLEQTYTKPVRDSLRAEYAKALPEFCIYSKGNGARVSKVEEENANLRREVDELKASFRAMSSHGQTSDLGAMQEEIKRIRDKLDFYDISRMTDKEKLEKAEEILGKPKKKIEALKKAQEKRPAPANSKKPRRSRPRKGTRGPSGDPPIGCG